jgi:hypothetical protein
VLDAGYGGEGGDGGGCGGCGEEVVGWEGWGVDIFYRYRRL